MTVCDYCQHVEMCGWRKEVNEQGCEFYDNGNRWIPVSERLPKEGQIVLVCQIYSWKEFEEGTEVTIAQYKRKHFTWYRYQKDWDKHTSIMTHGDVCPGNEYLTAWMPLPEPYKEG